MKAKLQLSRVGVTICLVIATLLYSIGPHATFTMASQGPCWITVAYLPTDGPCSCTSSLGNASCPPTKYNTIGFTGCEGAQAGSANCLSANAQIGGTYSCSYSYNYIAIAVCLAASAACAFSCAVIGPVCLLCIAGAGLGCSGCAMFTCTAPTQATTTLYASVYTDGTLTGSCPP